MTARWLAALALVLGACAPVSMTDITDRRAASGVPLPPMRSFVAAPRPQPVTRPNALLAEDFLDLSFALESGRRLPVFTRFEHPVKVRVAGSPTPLLRSDLAALLERLRREAGIEIALTAELSAPVVVEMVPRAAIRRVLPNAACFVAPNVRSLREYRRERRSKNTRWTELETRAQVLIVVPQDVSPQEARDCLHEELAQALGPLNDLYRLPDSVFNDDNVHAVLTDFDMLMLRLTYAPELHSGMTRQEVAARLPALLRRLNPGGERPATIGPDPTPRAWIDAIQTALGPDADQATRRTAADAALRIARQRGWTDHRRGFSHYAQGRALQARDPVAAEAAYLQADRYYAQSSQTRLHRAYVATQLAAFSLAAGEPRKAIALIDANLAVVEAAQNAALLASLQMLRAEALEIDGRPEEAAAVRLDSLGWARYGFGPDRVVRFKQREIAALTTGKPPA